MNNSNNVRNDILLNWLSDVATASEENKNVSNFLDKSIQPPEVNAQLPSEEHGGQRVQTSARKWHQTVGQHTMNKRLRTHYENSETNTSKFLRVEHSSGNTLEEKASQHSLSAYSSESSFHDSHCSLPRSTNMHPSQFASAVLHSQTLGSTSTSHGEFPSGHLGNMSTYPNGQRSIHDEPARYLSRQNVNHVELPIYVARPQYIAIPQLVGLAQVAIIPRHMQQAIHNPHGFQTLESSANFLSMQLSKMPLQVRQEIQKNLQNCKTNEANVMAEITELARLVAQTPLNDRTEKLLNCEGLRSLLTPPVLSREKMKLSLDHVKAHLDQLPEMCLPAQRARILAVQIGQIETQINKLKRRILVWTRQFELHKFLQKALDSASFSPQRMRDLRMTHAVNQAKMELRHEEQLAAAKSMNMSKDKLFDLEDMQVEQMNNLMTEQLGKLLKECDEQRIQTILASSKLQNVRADI